MLPAVAFYAEDDTTKGMNTALAQKSAHISMLCYASACKFWLKS